MNKRERFAQYFLGALQGLLASKRCPEHPEKLIEESNELAQRMVLKEARVFGDEDEAFDPSELDSCKEELKRCRARWGDAA